MSKQARIAELEAELKEARRVRDAWCREYVKVRDALKAARERERAGLRIELIEAPAGVSTLQKGG